ncbi:unnamed protein product [Polarella glacialis]|uniref:EXPERA domain-containing protein n=2 Tax=Polarella glacialis TaxID=89957 RepID=A0A813GH73_POLGL|nr:unnamed protein product [Polarella glacialis]CAE8622014.1 unnamed protein product [Polarella glacialis]CAE8662851.1 unnamed protein product [Polarella glacialis]CAE8678423.1 unnamed protein product [Polarella glacialis]CAE8716374.1 unnamed protein product [Polarella glacialis]
MKDTLRVYWPALFGIGTMAIQLILDPSPKEMWPPTLDFSGDQAVRVISSPVWLATVLPILLGLLVLRSFVRRKGLSLQDHGSMVWWLMNMLWFHTGCDVLSGYLQVMPILTELYTRMTPSHSHSRWHEARSHLDAVYLLEAFIEVPLCAWMLVLFARQDPGRHVAEVFAATVQFTGTVIYYVPGLVKMEAACWLSHLDRLCGSVWILFPIMIFWRTFDAARRQGFDKAMTPEKKSKAA